VGVGQNHQPPPIFILYKVDYTPFYGFKSLIVQCDNVLNTFKGFPKLAIM
jgi:hypothetical protein